MECRSCGWRVSKGVEALRFITICRTPPAHLLCPLCYALDSIRELASQHQLTVAEREALTEQLRLVYGQTQNERRARQEFESRSASAAASSLSQA